MTLNDFRQHLAETDWQRHLQMRFAEAYGSELVAELLDTPPEEQSELAIYYLGTMAGSYANKALGDGNGIPD